MVKMWLSTIAKLNIDLRFTYSEFKLLTYQFGPTGEGPPTLAFCRTGTKHATRGTHSHHTFHRINKENTHVSTSWN